MSRSHSLDLHRRLKRAARDLERAEKNVVSLFSVVLKKKIYQELGYGSIHLYASAELGFSSSKTSQFVRLSESLESLPRLKREVKRGAMPWTKAREVAKVATPSTEKAWIEVAAKRSRRELETTIAESKAEASAAKKADEAQGVLPGRAAPKAPAAPVSSSVTLRFTPEQLALFEVLVERLRKQGVRGSREDLLLAALEEMSGAREETADDGRSAADLGPRAAGQATPKAGPKPGPKAGPGHRASRARYQVQVKLCPSCAAASAATSRGDVPLEASTTTSILSDCDVVYPGKRKRSAIAPRTRRAVLERAGYRCEAKGCRSAHFLEIDHVIPVAAGGTNVPDNLRVLCSACHRARHRRDAGGSSVTASTRGVDDVASRARSTLPG